MEARSREIFIEVMGVAISEVSSQDACGCFEGCGYTVPVHPL